MHQNACAQFNLLFTFHYINIIKMKVKTWIYGSVSPSRIALNE